MYDTPYPVIFLGKERCVAFGTGYSKWIYRFQCRFGHKYFIWAERIPYEVFAVKFFLASHRHSIRKFTFMCGLNDGFRIFGTCLDVMVKLHAAIPSCSFCIIASPSFKEPEANTKRLQVYRKIVENYFSPITFSHRIYTPKSIYMVLNRKMDGGENSFIKVEKMVGKFFDLGASQNHSKDFITSNLSGVGEERDRINRLSDRF